MLDAMIDVVVVGARVAGAACARLLAQRGLRVVLMDKARFPSDTMSTLLLAPAAVSALARWELLAAIAAQTPAICQWHWVLDQFTFTGFPWTPDGLRQQYAPRRTLLDAHLVAAAAAAGVEIREGTAFVDVLRDASGTVVGVRAQTADGTLIEERARVVLGADGMRSRVAEAVGAKTYYEKPGLTFGYYAFYSGVRNDLLDSRLLDSVLTVLIPTNNGLTLAWAGGRAEKFHEFRTDIEGNLLRAFDHTGNGEVVRAGRREEHFVGSGPLPTFYRQSWGDGWALLGDAGYHKDAITAQGIVDAFSQAELVAAAVYDGLCGTRPLVEALADYQRTRDERTLPFCEWTYRLSALKAPSERVGSVLRALRDRPDDVRRFMGLNACTVSPADFFSPSNIARIVEVDSPT